MHIGSLFLSLVSMNSNWSYTCTWVPLILFFSRIWLGCFDLYFLFRFFADKTFLLTTKVKTMSLLLEVKKNVAQKIDEFFFTTHKTCSNIWWKTNRQDRFGAYFHTFWLLVKILEFCSSLKIQTHHPKGKIPYLLGNTVGTCWLSLNYLCILKIFLYHVNTSGIKCFIFLYLIFSSF